MSTAASPSAPPEPQAATPPAAEPTTAPAAEPDISLFEIRHRITPDELHRMADAGVFGPEPRVELIHGVIVDKMTKKPPHVIATILLERWLHRVTPNGFVCTMSNPLRLFEGVSEPEPDAMIFRGDPRQLAGHIPSAKDVVLIIEVADSSYRTDRHVKWRLYAEAGIPCYWVLDLTRRRLEIHSEPAGHGDQALYKAGRIYDPDEEVPLILDGAEVARIRVADLLP